MSENDYYVEQAKLLLGYSNCLRRKYACVIVKDKRIISDGFNYSIQGCKKCKREGKDHNSGDYAECGSIHAEQMALIRSGGRDEMMGARMYLVCDKDEHPEPCPICKRMLEYAGVEVVKR